MELKVKCCYYEKDTREKTMVLCTTSECPNVPGWKMINVVEGAMIKFDSPQGIDTEFFRGEPVKGIVSSD